jgi:nucleosome assembly protein 1-like 1
LTKKFYFSKENEQTADYSEGTVINWGEGKNVTVKLVQKKQKNKKTGQTRTVSKEEE